MPTTHEPSAKADRLVLIPVTLNLTAVAVKEEVGGYSIAIPALPGCVSQGETLEEATAMIREAAEGWLEVMHAKHLPESVEDFTGDRP